MVWLQRIAINAEQEFVFTDKLCRAVAGENVLLWNNDWVDNRFLVGFSNELFISKDIIKELKPEIAKDAVSPFYEYITDGELSEISLMDDAAVIPVGMEDASGGYLGS